MADHSSFLGHYFATTFWAPAFDDPFVSFERHLFGGDGFDPNDFGKGDSVLSAEQRKRKIKKLTQKQNEGASAHCSTAGVTAGATAGTAVEVIKPVADIVNRSSVAGAQQWWTRHRNVPKIEIVQYITEIRMKVVIPGVARAHVHIDLLQTSSGRCKLRFSGRHSQMYHAFETLVPPSEESKSDANAKNNKGDDSGNDNGDSDHSDHFEEFERCITLPHSVDCARIVAKHEHGVLYLTIPRVPLSSSVTKTGSVCIQ